MIEPVAFINVEERKLEWAGPVEWGTPTIARMDKVPLYTHQYSDLTDEEILEQSVFCFGNQSENFDDSYWINFARAILRKADSK